MRKFMKVINSISLSFLIIDAPSAFASDYIENAEGNVEVNRSEGSESFRYESRLDGERFEVIKNERIKLPVSWRQTRARFLPNGASTETENFKEVWVYERGENGLQWLESSRAKVQVFKVLGDQNQLSFTSIIIDKTSLIRLMGLGRSASREVDPADVLKLNLSVDSPEIKTVVNLSEDEQYLIHFRVASSAI
ncbi:MAG: hypothetical protein R3B45_12355 [Bdellovibrionota bacterium]